MDHDGSAGHHGTGKIENLPRQPLTFSFTRRDLFRSLRSEADRGRSMGDRPAFKLNTLGALPDEELADITPQLVRGCRLSVRDGTVWSRAATEEDPRRLCAALPENLLILRAIDGRTCLGDIADEVREETELADRSFSSVRALFLELVLARIATPV